MTKEKLNKDTTFACAPLGKSLRVDRIFAERGCAPQFVTTPLGVEELNGRGRELKTSPLDNCSIDELPGGKEIDLLCKSSELQKEVRRAEVVRRRRRENAVYYSVVSAYFVVCLVLFAVSLFFVLS